MLVRVFMVRLCIVYFSCMVAGLYDLFVLICVIGLLFDFVKHALAFCVSFDLLFNCCCWVGC